MKNEIDNKNYKINFIQTLVMGPIMTAISGQLKDLILSSVQQRTGTFLKKQFRIKCTELIKNFIINQLKGKFTDYLVDFIMTYIESNIDEIFNNKTVMTLAKTITDKIINGLGTYLFTKD